MHVRRSDCQVEQESERMTRYRAVVITDEDIQIIEHEDVVKSEQFEYEMKIDKGLQSFSVGDIDGDVYTVVYFKKHEPKGFRNDCIYLEGGICKHPFTRGKKCQWVSIQTAPYWVDGLCNIGVHKTV